jgi:hypothetical protein
MRSFLKAVGSCIVVFLLTLVATVVASEVSQRRASKNDIEYELVRLDKAYEHPQGLEDKVGFVVRGRTYKNIGWIRVKLYNRTSRAFSELPVRIKLKSGNAPLIGRMLLLPGEEDREHFAWSNSDDLSDLNFVAHALNISWENRPAVSLNLFFGEGEMPELDFATPSPGVYFTKFDPTRQYWFLLGYDVVLVPTAMALLVVLFFVGAYQFGKFMERWNLQLFTKLFEGSLYKYSNSRSAISIPAVVQIASAVFSFTMRKDRTILPSAKLALDNLVAELAQEPVEIDRATDEPPQRPDDAEPPDVD